MSLTVMRVFVIIFVLTNSVFISYAETVALILARGGSRGVKLKNLQTIGGNSLLSYAVHCARTAGIHNVTVSTDHPYIALEGLKAGAKIFRRSKITASDWAPSIWGVQEFLGNKPNATVLVLLQATSPFTRPNNLRAALELLDKPKPFDCVFSVIRSHKLRWQECEGKIVPHNFELHKRPRRQDWSGELLETGAFYITRRKLIDRGYFQNHNCTAFVVSHMESFEVDTYYDLKVANCLTSN